MRESVTIIRVIGSASGLISSQTPKTSSIFEAAAMIAEARVSFPGGFRSGLYDHDVKMGAACLTATAAARPT